MKTEEKVGELLKAKNFGWFCLWFNLGHNVL